MNDIKNLKPKKYSRYQQGYINPQSCQKLFEGLKYEKIIYRSSYEKKFINWLENSKDVYKWGSECIKIPYLLITDQKYHTYYPDYVVEMTNGDIYVIEIKPANQTKKPETDNSWASREYIKNMCKWKATVEFCKSKNYKFKILTENTINKL